MSTETIVPMLLTLEEAGRVLAVSPQTITRMIKRNTLVGVYPVADTVRVTRASVEAFIAKATPKPA